MIDSSLFVERAISDIPSILFPILSSLGIDCDKLPKSTTVDTVFDFVEKKISWSFHRKAAIYLLLYWDGDQSGIDNAILFLTKDELTTFKYTFFRKNNKTAIELLENMLEISLEAEFRTHELRVQTDRLSKKDLEALCHTIYENMIRQETLYKSLVKSQWGF